MATLVPINQETYNRKIAGSNGVGSCVLPYPALAMES